jgi:type IV pilus assembly protein PilW
VRCRAASGFSLLELLIALALSLTLIGGYFSVLQRCRSLFASNDSIAQTHDAARHALAVIAANIEHAGFYGFAPAAAVQLVRDGTVVASENELHQPTAELPATPVSGLPAGAHDCGVNFAVDLLRPVQGTDNRYSVGTGACEPTASAGGARPGADTLTLRHASQEVADARAGRIQLFARAASSLPLRLFADGHVPGIRDNSSEIRDLDVRTYYVANRSVGNPGLPALRVKSLTESHGAAQFRDEEVMPGVEDLQIELGIVDAADPVALRFITTESPDAATARVVAVRVWLRVRSETPDPGYRDDRTRDYSNASFTPDAAGSRFRRLLVSRTVAVRNGP